MHERSYRHMERLAAVWLADREPGVVLDYGALDVNGSYRPIFEALGWTYRGCDIAAGPNVDIVLEDPYRIPLPEGSVDLVISGQTFTHVEFFWVSMTELARVVRRSGLVFLIAPSRGHEHRYPLDCWRFYPDGFRALAAWAGLELLYVNTDWKARNRRDGGRIWGDTVGVFRKPAGPGPDGTLTPGRCE